MSGKGSRSARPAIEKIAVGKTKRARFLRHNIPKKRKFGRNVKRCPRCYSSWGVISKYGLNLCRRCFRNIAKELGFKKLR